MEEFRELIDDLALEMVNKYCNLSGRERFIRIASLGKAHMSILVNIFGAEAEHLLLELAKDARFAYESTKKEK